MGLKKEKEILDLVLSIPVEKWMESYIEIEGPTRSWYRIVGCKLNLKGVDIVLNLHKEILIIEGFEYLDERIYDLVIRVREGIIKSENDKGEKILNILLEAKKQGII